MPQSHVGRFQPVTLEELHVRLELLEPGHGTGLIAAAKDGELWRL